MRAFTRMCWIVACLGMLAGCGELESGAMPSGTMTVFKVDGRETPPPPAPGPQAGKITIVPSQVELGETATIRILGHQGAYFTSLTALIKSTDTRSSTFSPRLTRLRVYLG